MAYIVLLSEQAKTELAIIKKSSGKSILKKTAYHIDIEPTI